MAERKQHPVFAGCYALMSALTERGMGHLREHVLAPATGHTVIVGAGQAHDVPHLPAAVSSVIAVEPDAAMRRRGVHRLASSSLPAWYVAATAEDLPFPDESIDTLVTTLVLCSVDDPDRASNELRRVLRPGGRLLVLEHVRAATPRVAAAQHRVDGPWSYLSGGCHLTRDTGATLERAGFDVSGLQEQPLAKCMPLLNRGITGVALPR